jgi:hypothetical protein
MTDDDTNSRMRWIRLRKRLDELAPVVVVGLLVLGALGGWVAYQTHASPGVETEEQTVATWNEQGELSHAAEVTEPNPLFEPGQTLSERPVYFTGISPQLQGSYAYTYDASETGSLAVTLNASLRLQSVDSDGDPYWTTTEELTGTHVEDVSPGEQVTVETDVNVSNVVVEIQRIREQIGSTIGSSESQLVFDTQVVGTVNGESVANSHQRTLVIEPDQASYSVDAAEDEPFEESYESTEIFESERSYGSLRSYGSVLLILLSALGLVGFGVANYSGWLRPSVAERVALEQHQQREEFDEWISTGVIPTWERTGTEIELDSLEDLVDVAIDTNERVIEDRNSGDFLVSGGDRYYSYSPDTVESQPDRDSQSEQLTAPDASQDGDTLWQDIESAATGEGSDGSSSTDAEGAVRDRGLGESEDDPA